jgi:hypothetical protein
VRGTAGRADYPRKPRGVTPQAEEAFSRRISFCCDRDGCRKRSTPASVRFLGRRVYVGAVVVVACVLRQLSERSDVPVREPEAPLRTVTRWRRWWQTGLVASALYHAERGRFMPPIATEQLPLSLLERFSGAAGDKLKAISGVALWFFGFLSVILSLSSIGKK